MTITEMLAIDAIDHTPLDANASYEELKAQYVDAAEEFLATSATPSTTTDTGDETEWPSDETLESFLAWLRSRGWRLLDKPAGLYS